jgi:hypothetical protein
MAGLGKEILDARATFLGRRVRIEGYFFSHRVVRVYAFPEGNIEIGVSISGRRPLVIEVDARRVVGVED